MKRDTKFAQVDALLYRYNRFTDIIDHERDVSSVPTVPSIQLLLLWRGFPSTRHSTTWTVTYTEVPEYEHPKMSGACLGILF